MTVSQAAALIVYAPQSDTPQAVLPHSIAHRKCVYYGTVQSDGLKRELPPLDVDLAEMMRLVICNNVRMPVFRLT